VVPLFIEPFPIPPVVVPFMEPLPVEPLAAEPPAAEPPPAPPPAPPACARANVLESANTVAKAIVLNFMIISSWFERRTKRTIVFCSSFLERHLVPRSWIFFDDLTDVRLVRAVALARHAGAALAT
jgi:hypothetical protein